MPYYVWPSGREAVVKCKRIGSLIPAKRVVVKIQGLEPLELEQSIDGNPGYEIGTANRIIDVFEHREHNDIFYMTDDKAVLKELGVMEQ
jgi:predicted SPOUT superfamily RNA methylase MTH1